MEDASRELAIVTPRRWSLFAAVSIPWPHRWDANGDPWRTNGGPIAQWSRLQAGRSDDLGTPEAGLIRTSGGERPVGSDPTEGYPCHHP